MYQRVFGSQTRLVAACATGVLALVLSASTASADAAKDTAKCISTISKATAKYEVAVQKTQGKCQDALIKGKTPSCPDAKATDKIGKALTKLQDAISGACGSETIASIGFDGLAQRCNGGARAGLVCAKPSDCEGECGGGAEPGAPCTVDGNCPPTCFGGTADGESCKGGGATVCTNGGGVCNNPANQGHCNNPPGGTCDPADRCPAVIDDSAPFSNCDAPLATIGDVTTCVACNATSDANVITGFAFENRRPPSGNPAFGLPDNGDDGKSVLACQRALGKGVSKYFQKVRKATQKCTDGVLKAKIPSCPDTKLSETIAKAKTNLTDAISKKCGGTAYAETANLMSILADDPAADTLTPLPNSGPAFGDVASNLADEVAGCSDGFAVPISLGGCQTLCGNGQIDTGEDCDDGNVVNGDICPSDCHLNTTCAVTGTATVTVNVSADASLLPLGALTAYIAYDNNKVNIPGSGPAAGPAVTANAFSSAVNDLDSAIRVTVIDPGDIGAPPFTIDFNLCSGASVTAADFNCMVESASPVAPAVPAYGVTCTATP